MKHERFFNKRDIKFSLIFMTLMLIGGTCMSVYSLQIMTPEQLQGMTKSKFLMNTLIQMAVSGLFFSFFGLKLARATGLDKGILEKGLWDKTDKYHFNSKSALMGILIAFAYATVTVCFERFISTIFVHNAIKAYTFSFSYFVGSVTYGGFVEEIMLRLFFMSFITFILIKLFARKKTKSEIPSNIYWIAIMIASLLFALGHLPAGAIQMQLTPFLVVRIIFLNFIAGVPFGYLYWKKGLEYAMIAHMFCHIFLQLVFMPIFF